jgi:P27 family predicted phage terminase small subunit
MKKNEPPGHLSKEARKLWRELAEEWRIDDRAGTAILDKIGEAYDRANGARRQIDKEGLTITDRFGVEKSHPLLACERDARAQFLAGLKMLNLDLEPLRDGPGRPGGR